MGDKRLAILVPVLGRPHRVQPTLESIRAATPDPYTVLFLTSPGDRREHEAIAANGADMLTVNGNYARKINEGVRATDTPLVFLAADDLAYHPGWLEAAAARLDEPGVGVVGTNDLCNARVTAGEHSTHSLVTRAYADRGTIDDPSRLLHEGYPHEFVDDEFVGTAKHRGAFVSAPDSVVEHLHPDVSKAPIDHLYAARPDRMRRGRRVYRSRAHLWSV